MPKPAIKPSISVVIPTRNRAGLLRSSLESLARQTLARDAFEVVVVDDGSTDDTRRVCQRAAREMHLKYVRIDHAGISAAKNLGIFVSRAPLLFFFDDDDVASEDVLARHQETHRAYPAEHVAVLGYTTWAPGIEVTPFMHYATDVGGFLFCYGPLHHGQWLDHTYFWGGRTSCKRSLLVTHGIFNQGFAFGSEDIELGFRLERVGLKVLYNREAVTYMNRPVSYDDFCGRSERQGRSLWLFSRLHSDRKVQEYCHVADVMRRWAEVEPRLAAATERVHHLQALLDSAKPPHDQKVVEELHALYRFTLEGFMTKGIVAASERQESAA